MKRYFIKGSEALTPLDGMPSLPRTVGELFDWFLGVWAAETCAPRMRSRWSEDDPTVGQCSVTAFLVRELYGGRVFGVPNGDGNYHCYNVIGDTVFDLTCEQFHGAPLACDLANEQSAEAHFAKDEKRERYEILKARFLAKIAARS